MTKGTDERSPTRSCLVEISYKLFVVDDVDDEGRMVDQVDKQRFFLSEYDLMPSIDIVLQTMHRNERSLIVSDVRHCYGTLGCQEKGIPAVEQGNNVYKMKIELELHNWTNPPSTKDLSIEDRLFWGFN